jgi:hypothetical protein
VPYEERDAVDAVFNQILTANRMGDPVSALGTLSLGAREQELERLSNGLIEILKQHQGTMPATALLKAGVAKLRIMEDDSARAVSRLLSSGKARLTERSDVELSEGSE